MQMGLIVSVVFWQLVVIMRGRVILHQRDNKIVHVRINGSRIKLITSLRLQRSTTDKVKET